MRWLAVVAAAVLLAGCGGDDKQTPDDPEEVALSDALQYAPDRDGDSYRVTFTNWRAISRALDISATTRARATDLVVRTGELGAPFSTGLESNLWSQADIDWEARMGPDAEHDVLVVAVRKDFDFKAADKVLRACGLKPEDGVYHASLGRIARCAGRFGSNVPVFEHLALDPDERVLAFSHSREALDEALDNDHDIATDEDLRALSDALGKAQTTVAELEPTFCPGHSAFAAGLRYSEDAVTGRVVVGYDDEDAAADDLAVREAAVRDAVSPVSDRPYADILRLQDARAEDELVVLEVRAPIADLPLPLQAMTQRRDLGFAGC